MSFSWPPERQAAYWNTLGALWWSHLEQASLSCFCGYTLTAIRQLAMWDQALALPLLTAPNSRSLHCGSLLELTHPAVLCSMFGATYIIVVPLIFMYENSSSGSTIWIDFAIYHAWGNVFFFLFHFLWALIYRKGIWLLFDWHRLFNAIQGKSAQLSLFIPTSAHRTGRLV